MGAVLNKQEILTRALSMAVAERSTFLDTACGPNRVLRAELERLISDSQGKPAPSLPSSAGVGRTRLRTTRIRSKLRQALRQNYVIQERIGGGGMGDLYLATHKTLGGKWAIKVLAEDLAKDPNVVDRFINEAKIEANLKHPNIVKVFHIGHSGGYHYFVMDYIDGEDLSERMEALRRLPDAEAVAIAYQVCRALECAHDNNIFHRDLKPSNVRIDRYGTVIVLDFGIARARDVAMRMTGAGERMGTPLYMSPEQIKGGAIDARSDLYSLGVLLYEMLTGVHPFMADTAHGVYARHLHHSPQPPNEINPRIRSALAEIVMRLLEKDPDRRIQSARQLAAALRPFRDSTEVTPFGSPSPPADTKAIPRDERMTHLVVRVQETVLARDLSPEETTLLQLTDGKKTVGELLRLSRLEEDRFLLALDTLKGEAALRTIAEPAADAGPRVAEAAPPVQRLPLRAEPRARPSGRRRVYLLAALLLAVAAGGALFWQRPHHAPALSEPVPPVRFDAAPFARVRIYGAGGNMVLDETTPFSASLEKGRYTVEFEYQGNRRPREFQVDGAGPLTFRENFMETGQVDQILNSYLPMP